MRGGRKQVNRPERKFIKALGTGIHELGQRISSGGSGTVTGSINDGRTTGVYGIGKYGRCVYDLMRVGIYGGDTYGMCTYGLGTGYAGGERNLVRRVAEAYTTVGNDNVILCDSDGGAFTLTLLSVIQGKHYKVINCGSSGNDITVVDVNSESVLGASSQTLSDGEVMDVHYYGGEGWW